MTTAVNLVSYDSPDLKEWDNTNNPIWKRGLYVKLAITSYQTVLFLKDYPKNNEAVSLKMQGIERYSFYIACTKKRVITVSHQDQGSYGDYN